jgi:hypothetical protein
MGFFNKPGKAIRGAVNKVVREVDRVVMEKYQFQREYGTPQPPPVVNIIEETIEIDHEFPHYMKRNKLGLMIPLPEHYPTHVFKFVIFASDPPEIVEHKKWFNEKVFINISKSVANTENYTWIEYVTTMPEQITKRQTYWGNKFKEIIDHYK